MGFRPVLVERVNVQKKFWSKLKKMGKIAQAKLRGRRKHSVTVKGLEFKDGTEVHKFHQKIAHFRGALAKRFGKKIAPTQCSF
jgi:hypothetical protein